MSLQYRLRIDWDGDGSYAYDEAGRLLSMRLERGRSKVREHYRAGKLTFKLHNNDDRFTPWNDDGPLFGKLLPARGVKLSLYGDTNTEKLSNGGFETAGAGGADVFANWEEYTTTGASVNDEINNVWVGYHACRLQCPDANPGWARVRQTIAVTPATEYTLSFYTHGDGTKSGYYEVLSSDGTYLIAKTNTGVTGTTYTLVSETFLVPDHITSVTIGLYSPPATSPPGPYCAYFDAVSVLPVEYDLFAGRIEDLQPRGRMGQKTVQVVAYDALRDLLETQVDLALQESITTGAAIRQVLYAAGIPAGDNLLSNAGFETAGTGGLDLWADWGELKGDGSVEDETTIVHSGGHSAKLTGGATPADSPCVVQGATVEPGYYCLLRFYTRGDGTNAGRYDIYDVSNSTYILSITSTGITGTTWTPVEYSFLAPAGCTTVRLVLYCPNVNGGIAYFDDVHLYQYADIEAGDDTLEWFWSERRSALDIIRDLERSEHGLFLIARDGSPVFRERTTVITGGEAGEIDEDHLVDCEMERPWSSVFNDVRVTCYPVEVLPTTEIWDFLDKPQLAAGGTLTIWAEFSHPADDVITPVANVDYTANTAENGSGSDMTANLSVTGTVFSDRAKLELENTHASTSLYVTMLRLRGKSLMRNPTTLVVEDTASQASYGRRVLSVELPWQQDVNTAQALAEFLGQSYAEPTVSFAAQFERRLPDMVQFELGDRVRMLVESYELWDTMRVGEIALWTGATVQELHGKYRMEPCDNQQYWLLGDAGYSELGDTTRLGY